MEVIYSQDGFRTAWFVTPPSGRASDVQLAHAGADELAMLHMRALRLTGSFSAHEQVSKPLFGVMLLLRGQQTIRMRGSSHSMTVGDIAVWRNDVSCDFSSASGLEKLQVLVPAELMGQHWPSLAPEAGLLSVKANNAMPSLANQFLESLWRQRSYLGSREICTAVHAALDLLERGQHLEGSRHAKPLDRLSPIIRHIEESLEDPALTPASIATRFGYSIRTVHALFARHGRTVSEEIRVRRLERCHLALARSAPGRSIADIAAEWGFSDASHFSKLFKARYGMGPREYRNAFASPASRPGSVADSDEEPSIARPSRPAAP